MLVFLLSILPRGRMDEDFRGGEIIQVLHAVCYECVVFAVVITVRNRLFFIYCFVVVK